jgi:hypothetical protein
MEAYVKDLLKQKDEFWNTDKTAAYENISDLSDLFSEKTLLRKSSQIKNTVSGSELWQKKSTFWIARKCLKAQRKSKSIVELYRRSRSTTRSTITCRLNST